MAYNDTKELCTVPDQFEWAGKGMEQVSEEISAEQEWRWCLVGNIVGEHEHGENHELKYGTKQFRPGAKVFINLVYGGMRHENIFVIGIPRHSHRYIEIVIARKYVENFRLQKVFKPAVLKRMEQSNWDWPDNTDSTRDGLLRACNQKQGGTTNAGNRIFQL